MLRAERGGPFQFDVRFGVFDLRVFFLPQRRGDLEGNPVARRAFREGIAGQADAQPLDEFRGGLGGSVERRHAAQLAGVPLPAGGKGQVAEAEPPLHPDRIQQGFRDPALGERFREDGRAVARDRLELPGPGKVVVEPRGVEFGYAGRRIGRLVHDGFVTGLFREDGFPGDEDFVEHPRR